MTSEDTSRREFAELVSDHILGDIDRNVAATVVDGNRVSDHFWKNRGPTAPGSEHDLIAAAIQLCDPL